MSERVSITYSSCKPKRGIVRKIVNGVVVSTMVIMMAVATPLTTSAGAIGRTSHQVDIDWGNVTPVSQPATQAVQQAPAGISVVVDGSSVNFDGQAPVLVDGRTLVPVRGVFERLGFNVGWDSDSQTVTMAKPSMVISVTIGNPAMMVNGVSTPLEVPAQIINGRTMLPIRGIAEAAGYRVNWDSASQVISIREAAQTTPITSQPSSNGRSTTVRGIRIADTHRGEDRHDGYRNRSYPIAEGRTYSGPTREFGSISVPTDSSIIRVSPCGTFIENDPRIINNDRRYGNGNSLDQIAIMLRRAVDEMNTDWFIDEVYFLSSMERGNVENPDYWARQMGFERYDVEDRAILMATVLRGPHAHDGVVPQQGSMGNAWTHFDPNVGVSCSDGVQWDMLCLDILGAQVRMVTNYAGNHSWSIIQMPNGNWYHWNHHGHHGYGDSVGGTLVFPRVGDPDRVFYEFDSNMFHIFTWGESHDAHPRINADGDHEGYEAGMRRRIREGFTPEEIAEGWRWSDGSTGPHPGDETVFMVTPPGFRRH